MPTLVINVEFSDESDFDYFRHKFVGVVEDEVATALEGNETEPARADGSIEVSWDVED
jgi:hypothetical protein